MVYLVYGIQLCILDPVYSLLSVFCTWSMVYLEYAVLGVFFTWYIVVK